MATGGLFGKRELAQGMYAERHHFLPPVLIGAQAQPARSHKPARHRLPAGSHQLQFYTSPVVISCSSKPRR